MYWIAAFVSAAVIGVGGMFYLRYYLALKKAEISPREKKAALPAAAAFFAATAALMAAFAVPGDMGVFEFARTVVVMHCLFYLAVIDFKVKLIPNQAVLAMLAAWALLIAAELLCGADFVRLMPDLMLGGVIAGGLFFIGNLISRNGMGMGDVKLMAVTGLYLGMNRVMGLVFWALAAALVAGLALMAVKKAKMKTAIPLAPFFLAGSLISNTLYIISGFAEVQ